MPKALRIHGLGANGVQKASARRVGAGRLLFAIQYQLQARIRRPERKNMIKWRSAKLQHCRQYITENPNAKTTSPYSPGPRRINRRDGRHRAGHQSQGPLQRLFARRARRDRPQQYRPVLAYELLDPGRCRAGL